MRRKLVKQGNATYTVSLPKEWVERFNLKSGEDVDLEESGTQLVLSSVQKQKKYETNNFDFGEIKENLVHEFVVALYKSGMKDVALENINSTKIGLAKEVINNTIGFEILGSDKNKIHIADLGSSDEESLIKAEQQIYWRLLHMIERVLDKSSKGKEIHEIDLEINKLSFFIQRNLASRFSSSPKNFMLYEKVSLLESIGDFIRSFKIYSSLSQKEFIYLKTVGEFLDKLRAKRGDIEVFAELRNKLLDLENLIGKIKTNNKDSALASVLLYKTLKQLFDTTLALNVESFAKK